MFTIKSDKDYEPTCCISSWSLVGFWSVIKIFIEMCLNFNRTKTFSSDHFLLLLLLQLVATGEFLFSFDKSLLQDSWVSANSVLSLKCDAEHKKFWNVASISKIMPVRGCYPCAEFVNIYQDSTLARWVLHRAV